MAKSLGRYKPRLVLDQNGKCFYCHLRMRDDVTLEHLKAKKLGGGDTYSNFRAAHAKCNSLVGHLPVDVKLELHEIGKTQGSDAFFRAVEAIRARQKKAKKKNRLEAKKILQAAILDEYLERQSYRQAIEELPDGIRHMFQTPTPEGTAAARSRAAVRKMLERQQASLE